MTQATFDLEIGVGTLEEMLINFEVDYYIDQDAEVVINDYYCYYINEAESGLKHYERLPRWLEKKLEGEVEDYKYEMIANNA